MMLSPLKNHHPVFLLTILFQKIIPVKWVRFRRFAIFELGNAKADSDSRKSADSRLDSMANRNVVSIITEPHQIRELNLVTGVSPNDICGETVCVASENESGIVGGLYLKRRQFLEHELGLEVELPNDGWWLFSASVSKSNRRQGIYTQLLECVCEKVLSNEERVFFSVDLFNVPSLKAHHRYIGRECGRYFSLKIFNWGRTMGDQRVLSASSNNCHQRPMLISLKGNSK